MNLERSHLRIDDTIEFSVFAVDDALDMNISMQFTSNYLHTINYFPL